MSTNTPIRQWIEPLRSLALGVSLASFFVIPTASYPSLIVSQKPAQVVVEASSALPDGAFDLRTIHLRTIHGFESPRLSLTPLQINDALESEDIPQILRDISGLPVETLASLAHVSRNAYYKWLDGKGVSDEHINRLHGLLDTFRTLQNLRGPIVKEFLEFPGPAGRPIDLLLAGDNSAVIGLALRSSSKPIVSSAISDDARRESNLPGWLHPASRLDWEGPHLTEAERDEALEQLSPRPLSTEVEPVSAIDEENEAFVAWGFNLE